MRLEAKKLPEDIRQASAWQRRFMKKESLPGKTVLVMGLGRFGGGVDVAEFAHRAGARVIVTDLASAEQLSDSLKRLRDLESIEFHLGSHAPADFEQAGARR